MQVLDITLKKIEQSILKRIDENLDDVQKRTLDATTSQLIQNCSFMGAGLFGNIFNVYVGKKLFEFEISNPLLILKTDNYEGVLAYIQDKKDEIKNILSKLASTISMDQTLDNRGVYEDTIDFKNLFK